MSELPCDKLGIVMRLVVVAVIVAAVFSFGITGGHISMDDWGYIYGCPFVRDGLTADNLRRSFTEIGYDAFWMPFTYVTYMCDISFFGGGWSVHHAVNVVLHVINAVLVLLVLRRAVVLTCDVKERWALALAAAASLIWAVHPMRAEAVTYVASRKELLWSFFTLAGLLFWMDYLFSGRRFRYGLAVLCCLLACQSKPTAVCFPVLAYLLEVLCLKQWRPASVRRYLPLLLIAFAVGCVILHAQANPIEHEHLDIFGETFAWRLLNAGVGFGMYLWHTIVPTQVHFDYRAVFGGCPLDLGLGLTTLVVAAGMLATALYVLRRDGDGRRALIVFALWFVVALAPVSGIMGTVNGDHAYADRYTYLPFVGVMAIVVVLGTRCPRHIMRGLAIVSVAGTIWVSMIAVDVVRSFENDFLAFSRTLRQDPDHWRALRVVGNEYCARRGRMDEGVRMLERSLALRPSQHTAESLAYILSIRGATGDFERVRELCAGVVRQPSKDHHGMMLDALGTVCLREGKDVDAVRFYRASLKADRRNYSSNHTVLNLALALANSGRRQESLRLLVRLSESTSPGVKACCARLIAQLQVQPSVRFVWTGDPFTHST